MFGYIKDMYKAISEGFYLSRVAIGYTDPDAMRIAVLKALGASDSLEPARTERPAEEQRELVAA